MPGTVTDAQLAPLLERFNGRFPAKVPVGWEGWAVIVDFVPLALTMREIVVKAKRIERGDKPPRLEWYSPDHDDPGAICVFTELLTWRGAVLFDTEGEALACLFDLCGLAIEKVQTLQKGARLTTPEPPSPSKPTTRF